MLPINGPRLDEAKGPLVIIGRQIRARADADEATAVAHKLPHRLAARGFERAALATAAPARMNQHIEVLQFPLANLGRAEMRNLQGRAAFRRAEHGDDVGATWTGAGPLVNGHSDRTGDVISRERVKGEGQQTGCDE